MQLHLFVFVLVRLGTPQLTEWEEAHQPLHRYPFIIDTKAFDQLGQILSEDAHADYGTTLAGLDGLPAIRTALEQAVAGVQTHHMLGTTIIDFEPETAKMSANATTYVQASLFSELRNNLTTVLGYYLDRLSKDQQSWRINDRKLVYQVTAFQTNASLGAPGN